MTIIKTPARYEDSGYGDMVAEGEWQIRGSEAELRELAALIIESINHRGVEGVGNDEMNVSVWCDCD